MNVLLIGGCSSLTNNLIVKLNKEGHRVYLLTGSRDTKQPYQKAFEKYHFPYNANCLNEIFESISPDVTIFMGAYDTNFNWKEESDAVKFSAGMMNIMMGYLMSNSGKFILLSSEQVYEDSYDEDITEEVIPKPRGLKSIVLTQAEEMCENHRKNLGRDIVVLRLDQVYGIPDSMADVTDYCTRMCLEALDKNIITIRENHTFSMLYAADAIEYIYRVVAAHGSKYGLYHVSAQTPVTERELAEQIRKNTWFNIEIVSVGTNAKRNILSAKRFQEEFGTTFLCDRDNIVKRIADHMKKYKRSFLYGEKKKKSLRDMLMENMDEFLRNVFPFIENFVLFIVFFMLNNRAVGSTYFSNLDFYLLYVLLFAIVYGQQQSIISAALATAGYCFRQMYDRTGFELMLDSGTYIWIAQLFILGLTVGYMRDTITKLRSEQITEREFLTTQLSDIKDINDSNVRVKDALETQLVNQSDSVGKIYKITSRLEHYSQEEVLFYAGETIGELMKSEDVAIYTVHGAGASYARLFSATSPKARSLGNSIRYAELGEVYEAICDRKVFINRKLDDNYPLMANGVYDDDGNLQIIVMIWGLPWESMTLGQANQLVVVSALIGNAMVRANKYLALLEQERYIEGSKLMEADAFTALVDAYMKAEKKGYTSCTVLRILETEGMDYKKVGDQISTKLRNHDYVGRVKNGNVCVLLSNTNHEEALPVVRRLAEIGYDSVILGEINQ
ncbi:MAG: NAD(P)-dependent oxidoreductase [Acetatifactor sp.]|nr:NAD(P)-dependent oxidoreductase [Acetatifactor sp.]